MYIIISDVCGGKSNLNFISFFNWDIIKRIVCSVACFCITWLYFCSV